MKKRLLLIFLLIIPIVIAQPQVDYNDLSEMDLNFNLDSQFFLAPTREQYGIDFIETNLTFFPQNRLNEVPIQTVLSLSTKSFPEISVRKEADSLVFRWEKPVGQQYLYGLSSKINLKNNLLQIKDGIKFPITSSEYPEKVILIGREKSGEMKMSLRSKEIILPRLIEKALVGIKGYGGGHDFAIGSSVKIEDFERFIENLNKLLKTKD